MNRQTISKHISYDEAIFSATAIRLGLKNEPDDATLDAMKAVAENCFEPLREWYGKPLRITSFYRSFRLNVFIGGSINSQHCRGEAIDISAFDKKDNAKLFEWAKNNLLFDQLIWEYGDDEAPAWVHISYKSNGINRNQVLRIPRK
jgi:hypothetical protein